MINVRAWLRNVTYHVALVFALTFVGALISNPAGLTHLDALRAAAVGALSAALAVLYASLGQLKQGAASLGRVARSAVVTTRAVATGWDSLAGRRLHIGIVLQVDKAAVTYADAKRWLGPLGAQLTEFCKAWQVLKPQLTVYSSMPANIDGLHMLIVVLDNADQAGALGYHDETDTGIPYARVFALDCERAGVSVSSCVSHELLEAVADLACDRWAQAPDGRLFAIEVCDPVEADAYVIGGVEVSNYVTPSYFDDHGHAPYDRLGKLTGPFTLAASGYAIVQTGGKIGQVFGDRRAYDRAEGWRKATKKSPLSRTARRLAG